MRKLMVQKDLSLNWDILYAIGIICLEPVEIVYSSSNSRIADAIRDKETYVLGCGITNSEKNVFNYPESFKESDKKEYISYQLLSSMYEEGWEGVPIQYVNLFHTIPGSDIEELMNLLGIYKSQEDQIRFAKDMVQVLQINKVECVADIFYPQYTEMLNHFRSTKIYVRNGIILDENISEIPKGNLDAPKTMQPFGVVYKWGHNWALKIKGEFPKEHPKSLISILNYDGESVAYFDNKNSLLKFAKKL